MNDRHHYEIALTVREGKHCLIVRRRIGTIFAVVAQQQIDVKSVVLEIKADKQNYTFSYLTDKAETKQLAIGESRYLSTEVAGGFTGVYFAMYATGNGKEAKKPAYFDWFDYKPLL